MTSRKVHWATVLRGRRTRRIAELVRKELWADARRLLRLELKESPESHWLLTRLGATCYEQHRYKTALRIERKALRLSPQCPLVLWDIAGSLDALGNRRASVRIWRRLMARGVQELAHGECGEGVRWARSLINDCRYRIGCADKEAGNNRSAAKYLRAYLAHRRRGVGSIYSLRDARKELDGLVSPGRV